MGGSRWAPPLAAEELHKLAYSQALCIRLPAEEAGEGRRVVGSGRSRLLLIFIPLCLQTETLWAPGRLCLRACLLATMTHPRTATYLDTMTCLQYGIPRHPHFGARTVEEPRWCAEVSTPVLCCSRLRTEPAVPCQEQGEDWPAVNMNMFNRGSEWRGDGSLAPRFYHGKHWSAGNLCSFSPTHCSPRPPGPCIHKLVG